MPLTTEANCQNHSRMERDNEQNKTGKERDETWGKAQCGRGEYGKDSARIRTHTHARARADKHDLSSDFDQVIAMDVLR